MNILIPHKWLLEHLDTEAPPTELQKHVSLSGPSVERLYDRLDDTVYDIEVTTNRVDSMSVRGIAREAAVILTNANWPSTLKPLVLPELAYEGEKLPLPEIINQGVLCQRILCVVLDDVQRGESPEWLKHRLEQVDLNHKDVTIDITNAISHELGHPCHAFDYDKIMALGGEIHVVEAEPDMPFTTLDGESYQTKGGEVVYVNQQGEIIDLPGIMGTLNTAVDDSTKRILFWVESISAEKVRFASMAHNIRTPAAQLNERELAHELGREVLLKGTEMFLELTGARVASMIYDEIAVPNESIEITLTKQEIFRYLGIHLPETQVEKILTQLGCTVTVQEEAWLVTPPHFRTDLAIPADLVEEVARIYGYHNLPSRILQGTIPTQYPTETNFSAEETVAQTLAALGYQEQITYSLVAANTETSTALPLKNALTTDKEVLRQHLLPSHLAVMEGQWGTSLVRGTFELANVYTPREQDLPDEHLVLAITDRDMRALRSTLEVLRNRLFIDSKDIKIEQIESEKDEYIGSFLQQAKISTQDGQLLGMIGVLPGGMAGVELEWRALLAVARRWPTYRPLPKTAAIYEDWTFALEPRTPVETVYGFLRTASARIKKVALVSQYENRVTFRVTLHDSNTQLRAEDGSKVREEVVEKLGELPAKLLS